MAALSDRLVLFGGELNSSAGDTSTWEWDGAQWMEKKLSPNPGERRYRPAMASLNGKVYLIQGTFSPSSEMWVYDGSQWAVAPGSVPPRRIEFTFGSAANKLVMAGGYVDGNNPSPQDKETWTWNGGAWSQENSQTQIRASFYGTTVGNSFTAFNSFSLFTWNGSAWSTKSFSFCDSNTGPCQMAQGAEQTLIYQSASQSTTASRTVLFDVATSSVSPAQQEAFRNPWEQYGSVGHKGKVYFLVQENSTQFAYLSVLSWTPGTHQWQRLFAGNTKLIKALSPIIFRSGEDLFTVSKEVTYLNGTLTSSSGYALSNPASGTGYKGKAYIADNTSVKVFNGASWVSSSDFAPPPSQSKLATLEATDPAQDRLFAFAHNGCHEWVGGAWQAIPACSADGIVLQGERNIYLVGGGSMESPTPSSLQRWDGSVWKSITTSGINLDERRFPLFGALADKLILSGGQTLHPSGYCNERDLYTLDVANVDGSTCSASSDCASGFCVDGVCCDTACAGLCEACSAAKKGQGNDGACGPVANNTDPDDECSVLGTSDTCKTKGVCNGAKKCESKGGITCKSSACESASTQIKASLCNDVGECIDQGSKQCFPFLCAGGACLTTCSKDQDCQGGYFCQNAACVASADQGKPCSKNSECGSNSCVDGVCCDTACTGACKACSAAKKGYGSDGTCQDVLADTDPDNECPVQGPCGSTGACDGKGACAQSAQGAPCGSTSCADGQVTGQVCDGQGKCISSAQPIACTPYLQCSDAIACASSCGSDSQCAATHYCDTTSGKCLPDKADGVTCNKNAECASGSCADGVCCNEACDGSCEACKIGDDDPQAGICRAVSGAPLVGHPNCPGAGDCKGFCDGFVRDTCVFPADEKACGDGVCESGKVSGSRCDGKGSCVPGLPKSCFPYSSCADGTNCLTNCANDGQCDGAYFCDPESKTCQADKDLGASCTKASECSSGNCVDGLCCNEGCSGACQTCKALDGEPANLNGTCHILPKGVASLPGHPACGAGDAGCGSFCDGSKSDCSFPAQGTECAPPSCASPDTSTLPRTCDGSGKCEAPKNESCAPFVCDDASGACKTKCSSNSDCSTGAVCSTNGQCTLGEASCADKSTAKAPDGSLKKCDPYTCLNGQCRDSCSTDLDCTSDFECNAQQCVPRTAGTAGNGAGGSAGTNTGGNNGGGVGGNGTAPASEEATGDDGGACGCRAAGSARSEGGAAGLLLGLALAARRRRRPAA